MKIARINWAGKVVWAEFADDGNAYEIGGPGGNPARGAKLGPIDQARLLAPIEPQNKVVALMGNWSGRNGRQGSGLWIKPNNCIIPTGAPIRWPKALNHAPYFEAELAVVIGKKAKDVSVEDAKDHIFGFTITNDMTAFGVLQEDTVAAQSFRFKLYDDFLPMGPWIETDFDPKGRELRAILNGEVKQRGVFDNMAFDIYETLSWASGVMTLEVGDIISMGTPPGYVEMARGDVIRCEIDGIGAIENQLI
ncbi:fumarylacetoacetate hydrolase family protein [Rhizorhabdus dicambivorans]|uniref:Fumarylacetoacetase-like C-terminal domain-containing protein n=1 Tax=Rhizorhabdus dicambivorans TaxID=1850238 RepID=A0A2A4FQR5_9SPHN|nr:fumarylacetoacetate hydrolase family protein [Rhizorhabdus dicambivorans]ATE64678.1 hypothetical protein CMV14_09890 [Rhizorhabdus dicambivorans]PCE39788.1 hypothetical protein COO09_23580 [Rhizorhabdus dicambivorans]